MSDEMKTALLAQPLQWGDNLEYKPSDVSNIMASADSGDLEPLADFADWLLADERVNSTLNTRVNALLGCELDFEGDEESCALWKTYWTESFPEHVLGQWIKLGLLTGIAALNVAWKQDSAGMWWPDIQFWHLRNIKADFRLRKFVAYGDYGLRVEIDEHDPSWVILTPYGAMRPWALGTWRNIALLSLGKMLAWRDWNRKNEITGIGIIKGMCPAGTSDADRRRFGSDVGSLGRNSKIILTEGYDVKVDDRSGADTSSTFAELIKTANTMIAISHLGQNLSTEVEGGSYAAATAHNAVRQDDLEADAQVLSTVLHDELLTHWGKYNNRPVPWPRWKLKQEDDAKLSAETAKIRAESIKTMAEAAGLLRELGVQIDVAELVREQVKIQEKREEDESDELSQKCNCSAHVALSLTDELKAPTGQGIVDEAAKEAISANELSGFVDVVLREIEATKDEKGWELNLAKRLNELLGKSDKSVEAFTQALEQALVVAQLAVGVDDLED
ncbi:MAG: DUF935 family protein [Chloroflexia bacterium]|nr:DUF935 family protein [Chloroflexia bacterium]